MLWAFASYLSHLHKAQLPVSGKKRPCTARVTCSSMARASPSVLKRPAVSRDAVAIPPTQATMQLAALVEHILVREEGRLSDLIAEELDISTVGPCDKQLSLGGHAARSAPDPVHILQTIPSPCSRYALAPR